MRKIATLTFILAFIGNSYSQDVSVTFSINWVEGSRSLNSLKVLKVPYLTITYANNTGNPIYFLKLLRKDPYLSYNGGVAAGDSICQNDKILKRYRGMFKRDKFKVVIDGAPSYNSYWEVLGYSAIFNKAHEVDIVNSYLSKIYSRLLELNNISDSCFHLSFDKTVVTHQGIRTSFRDSFVFLEPKETYVDKISLIGFEIVGGTYCFDLRQKCSLNFVYSEPLLDENKGKLVRDKIPLPKKVDGYYLYKGKLISNSVKIEF